MAFIQVNVEEFCILAVKVGGHREEKCPQCKALKTMALTIHNNTIDEIVGAFEKVPDGQYLDPKKTRENILKLKTHPENIR